MSLQTFIGKRLVPLKTIGIAGTCLLFLVSCSTGKKKTEPELSSLRGKKVALVGVDGEDTARKVIEVSLVNQLVQRGTFILISKQDLEQARLAPEQDPMDWKGIAKRSGAEVALRAKVLKFDAQDYSGYTSEEVYDSQLAEEHGTDGKTQRVYKVKSLNGDVQILLEFTTLDDTDTRSAVAEAQDKVVESEKTSSIHLPARLRFLETLTNKAFKTFFERYN
jgi:hypothetical protein